jgi:hypothetical protein
MENKTSTNHENGNDGKPPVIGSVCDECGDGSGWYGCEDITYNCSKCNPEAK